MTQDIDDDTYDIIHSQLERTLSGEGHSLKIAIYRGADEPDWILEIEDETGTSTVFDERFATDQAALDAALAEIEADGGMHLFCVKARAEASAINHHRMMVPLSEKELKELERFLVYQLPSQIDCMTLDELDGFLHAIAIGPETVMPNRWLPRVWGQDGEAMMPPTDNLEQLNHLLGLIMRHYNSIVSHFEQMPDSLQPIFGTDQDKEGEYEDAGLWAHGFTEGVKLSLVAWQPLLSSPKGQEWYRPLQLLGDDDVTMVNLDLLATKEQIQLLNRAVVDSVMLMHAYWLPLRHAMAERQIAQAMSTKVGRNEPCPCGSGKKFKKCCGSPIDLH
jgi:uncharacterized protein